MWLTLMYCGVVSLYFADISVDNRNRSRDVQMLLFFYLFQSLLFCAVQIDSECKCIDRSIQNKCWRVNLLTNTETRNSTEKLTLIRIVPKSSYRKQNRQLTNTNVTIVSSWNSQLLWSSIWWWGNFWWRGWTGSFSGHNSILKTVNSWILYKLVFVLGYCLFVAFQICK